MTFAEITKKLRDCGPDRIVINADGEATTSRRARREYNIYPAIIFVRDDGWMLGAPANLVKVAEEMWRDEWIAVLERGSWDPIPYDEWRQRQ
jgi:hypothetical protein